MNHASRKVHFSATIACSLLVLLFAGGAHAAAPQVGSGVVVSPDTSVYAGQVTTLIVYAFDADGDSLTYKYNFGDGQSESSASTLSFRFHTYASPGTYNVSCAVS